MPCNCGKKNNGQKQQYVFIAPNGAETKYNTEVEARAAVIRAGGGSVRPA